MTVARRAYRARLVAVEDQLLRVGEGYRAQLAHVMLLTLRADAVAAAGVVEENGRLDVRAGRVRDEALELIALQSPVADDLRLLAAVLSVGTAVGRIGEVAVDVAGGVRTDDPDLSEPRVQELAELGTLVDRLIGRSLEQFARRRPDDGELEVLRGHVDILSAHLQERLVATGQACSKRIDWVVRTALTTARLTQAGVLATAIARQVPYLVWGESSAADHPDS